jgi:predicted P-loop ATPase
MTDFEAIRRDYPISFVAASLLGVVWDRAKSTATDLYACCPLHREKTPSFHVEEDKGLFYCHGCGKGGDVIKLVQESHNVDAPEAARIITGEVRDAPAYQAPATPRTDPNKGFKYVPAPADAPAIVAGKRTPPLRNPKREDGKATTYTPEDVYPYYAADGALLGYVLRVVINGTKLTPQIWWMVGDGFGGWSHGSFPGKRPMDGLVDLLAHPGKQVLIVEGEKCRKAAAEALKADPGKAAQNVVVVSWMGGTKAVGKTDFSPLAGRNLILWPDNDEAGRLAMYAIASVAKAAKVKVVAPYGDKGGDVADLIATGGSVADYIKANISEFKETCDGNGTERRLRDGGASGDAGHVLGGADDGNRFHGSQAEATPLHADTDARVEVERDADHQPLTIEHRNQKGPLDLSWEQELKFTKDGAGLDKSSIHNCQVILEYHEDFKGLFAYNAFSKEIMVMRRPPWERSKWGGPRAIIDSDAVHCIAMMENIGWGGLKPKRSDMEAVIFSVAEFFQYNPVLDAMEALEWDGLPRLQGGKVGSRTFAPFGVRYMGVEPLEINRIFFTKALVGLVARVYQPGCKLDTTLILEGGQGVFKSTAIKALADGLVKGVFTDEIADPGSKDAGLQMQGKWIIEFSEMASLKRSDIDTTKGWLSRQNDRFRPPFGRSVHEYPRVCGFVGSTNPPAGGYFRDPTGARRFWPVRVGEVDLGLIKEDAAQIWAEARDLYKAGHHWWLNKEEEDMALVVQSARYESDPWSMMIDDYLSRHTDALNDKVRVLDLMGDMCLRIHNERRTPVVQARIEAHLNMIGWRKVEKGVYKRPSLG